MKPYRKERIENAICFFAREHHKKTRQYPWSMHIYKYLAFFEYRMLEKTGEMPLDYEYLAMKRGPVPKELYNGKETISSDYFAFEHQGDNKYIVKPLKKPNLDYFSEIELEEMENLILFFGQRWVHTGTMSDSSHEKIKAWKKTWLRNPNSIIDNADTFDNIKEKPYDELTPAEEHFLISESLKHAGC